VQKIRDKLSGAIAARPGLDAALNYARQNDCFVVWRLDRLGRSLKNLIQLVEDLDNRGRKRRQEGKADFF